MIVVSMLAGAAGVMASSRIQVNQQTQRLLEQQQGEMQVAELQMALAQKSAEEAKKRAAVGVATQEQLMSAQHELVSAQLNLERMKLNVQEISQSGQPVQDDITAKSVSGRDFVAERLRLEERSAQMAWEEAGLKAKNVKTRYEAGLSGEIELAEAQTELLKASTGIQTIHDKILLREQFVAGQITAAFATRQRQVLAARSQLRVAEMALELATKRYAAVQKRVQVGMAGEVERLQAQLEMLSKQQDVLTLQTRIRTLEAEK
jgi:outer membrane protein TolC